MADFKALDNYNIHNDYYTPRIAWQWLTDKNIIPSGVLIWEACMLNSFKSKSPQNLQELGHNVVYDYTMDCLTNKPDVFDMIITNPPFETKIKIQILERFVALDKPFILTMNACNMFSNYMRYIFKDKLKYLQVIYPKGKIQYDKLENGEIKKTNNCSFYSVFVCYKLNLSTEQLWL